jgi:hypothetical protein
MREGQDVQDLQDDRLSPVAEAWADGKSILNPFSILSKLFAFSAPFAVGILSPILRAYQ